MTKVAMGTRYASPSHVRFFFLGSIISRKISPSSTPLLHTPRAGRQAGSHHAPTTTRCSCNACIGFELVVGQSTVILSTALLPSPDVGTLAEWQFGEESVEL